ncbi:MAG: DUF262 domain-containing protein [Acidobacteria bacterium]|nr:DUF262 domain-containing protein [Acidobacteriota bacterium]
MAKSNLLNTQTPNFQGLIGNGRIYRVPKYQRDYSWEEEQWEDLWNDILELRDKSDDRHYMGALVVEELSDREFMIIDGQQRLATLSILALAVIAKLVKIADRGVEPEANRERASSLRNLIIGEKDPASLVESSKLFLNDTDDAFYQDYLVQLHSPRNPRGMPKSNRLLWECFRYFSGRLDEVADFDADGKALASLISETVARQLLFILITVDDELNAYTVFETLNARGIELSATDLLKNYLLSRVKVESDLEALHRRWRSLLSTVAQERFPEFLRYHLLCDQPKIRSQRLFKLVRERVKAPEQVFVLMNELDNRADLFSALGDPNHGYWIETPDCRPHIRDLNLFRVKQMTPLLFAVWERFPKAEFARVLKLVSIISFRYTVVSGLNTNSLEPVYHHAAKAVLDGIARTARDVFEQIKGIYVEDEKFKQDFSRLSIETAGQRKKLAKYILAKLESDRSNRSCDPDTDPGSIEHILPENPTTAWETSFPRQHWETSVYRIGNLTLLEPSLNRQAGNVEYPEKLRIYAGSNYNLTRGIIDLAPQDWTPELLNERQRKMAARAAHIWRADFASITPHDFGT